MDISTASSLTSLEKPKKAVHTYFDNGSVSKIIEFLYEHPLEVDMFSSARGYWPMQEFLTRALSASNNKFQDHELFGVTHLHLIYTKEELEEDSRSRALMKKDPRFPELISPGDASRFLKSARIIEILTKGEIKGVHMLVFGVTAINANKELFGSSYFDSSALSQNSDDYDLFETLVPQAISTTDVGLLWEFLQLARKYSPPTPPSYVAFSSAQLEKVLIDTIKNFPALFETSLYLTGDSHNMLDRMNVPEKILGVGRPGEYAKRGRDLSNLTDIKGKTQTLLGMDQETNRGRCSSNCLKR